MKKKVFFVSAALCFSLIFFSSIALSAEYWGSKNSNKYHRPTCKWAQKINPNNLVKFNSPEAAKKAGYVPCKVCKPPLSSQSKIKNNQVKIADIVMTQPSYESH